MSLSMETMQSAPRGRLALSVMALAGVVFVGAVLIKPSQPEATDPVAAAVEPMESVIQTAPPEAVPAEMANAAAEGVGAAVEEASPIDWAMLGSIVTFIFSGFGALGSLVFGLRSDARKERLAALRARELELEIERLQMAARSVV